MKQDPDKKEIIENIENIMGFVQYTSSKEKEGWLLKTREIEQLSTEFEKIIVSGLEMYFLCEDDTSFKIKMFYQPYFYVKHGGEENIIYTLLKKKYKNEISKIEPVKKTDLSLPNHLSGIKSALLKVFFYNTEDMERVSREIRKTMAKELILDIYEYDIPYITRCLIDLELRIGQWYCVSVVETVPKITLFLEKNIRPDPRTIAFDIETAKRPLLFPDPGYDPIILISIMFDDAGYLIVNREHISADIENFEYAPTEEYRRYFTVFNEKNEHQLLYRFFWMIQQLRPVVFVTFNGDAFDWPYIAKRSALCELDLFSQTGIEENNGVYTSSFSLHADVYKWAKRDSYLPVGSQGLKSVTEIKLGFAPLKVDFEETAEKARIAPFQLASYAVSDALSTYYLYMKHVNPFLFSMCNIIPYSFDDVLRKGTGTLCEALLMAEAFRKDVLIPNKTKGFSEKFHDNHLLSSETYAGGYVETIEPGLFRTDLPIHFKLDAKYIESLIENIETVFDYFLQKENLKVEDLNNYIQEKERICLKLKKIASSQLIEKPKIMHFDISAMYPNIILTNRLQPFSIVTPKVCAACDFNIPENRCKRKMIWTWKIESFASTENEFRDIENQILCENKERLTNRGKRELVHERFAKYTQSSYKKAKKKENIDKEETVCMRENPFYIDTVRSFRDKRYYYKNLQREWKTKAQTEESVRMAVLYDSLQLAHKCILNSFYGYVMRRGARWYSIEMAGIVCKTGTEIIKDARKTLEKIGRPIELDTDGIWTMFPQSFPDHLLFETKDGRTVKTSYICQLLNHQVAQQFTNEQYFDGNAFRTENTLLFEVDGPYHAMFIPSSTEKDKMLKKRYLVFNEKKQLVETKGFEIKRRGELKIIKKIQVELFPLFLSGKTLAECYKNLGIAVDRWLSIFATKGKSLHESNLLDLLCEEKTMAKPVSEYGTQKSCAITTAKRLNEFCSIPGSQKGLLCRYIIAKEPRNKPVAERAIPADVFKYDDDLKKQSLLKWTGQPMFCLRDIIDWKYYDERISSLIQKLVSIPAALQGIENPVAAVQVPQWCKTTKKNKKLTDYFDFQKENKNTKNISKHKNIKKQIDVVLKIEQIDNETFRVWKADPKGVVSVTVQKHRSAFYSKRPVGNAEKTYWTRADGQEKIVLYGTDERQGNNIYPNISPINSAINSICSFVCKKETPAKPSFNTFFLFFYQSKERMICALFMEHRKVCKIFVLEQTRQIKAPEIKDWKTEVSFYATQNMFFEKIHSNLDLQQNTLVVFESNQQKEVLRCLFRQAWEYPTLIYSSHTKFPGLEWQSILLKRAIETNNRLEKYIEEAFLFSSEMQIPIGNFSERRYEASLHLVLERALLQTKVLFDETHKKTIMETKHLTKSFPGHYTDQCVFFELDFVCVNAILQCKKIRKETELEQCKSSFLFDALKRIVSTLFSVSLEKKQFNSLLSTLLEEYLLDADVKRYLLLLVEKTLFLLMQCIEQTTSKIIFCSQEILAVCTSKKTKEAAESFVQYFCEHLLQQELFKHIKIRSIYYWDTVLWLDAENFSKGFQDKREMKWTVAEYLPFVARIKLKETVSILQKIASTLDIEKEEQRDMQQFKQQYLGLVSAFKKNEKNKMSEYVFPNRIGCFPETTSISIEFAKTMGVVFDLFKSNALFRLKEMAFAVLGKSVFSDETIFRDPFCSLVLNNVVCFSCGRSQSIDFCRDPFLVVVVERKENRPIRCLDCGEEYSMEYIEAMLIGMVDCLLTQYNRQEILCGICQSAVTKLSAHCERQKFVETFCFEELRKKLKTLRQLSAFFRFSFLRNRLEIAGADECAGLLL